METNPTVCPRCLRRLTRARRRVLLAYLRFLAFCQGPLIRVRMARPLRFWMRAMLLMAAVYACVPHNPLFLLICFEFGVWGAFVLRRWGTHYDGPERRRTVMVRNAHWV